MTISNNRTGDIQELKAVTILMEEGWEVFRNCGCDGPVDIVILNKETGEIKLIDIKTPYYHNRKDGTKSVYISVSKKNNTQKDLGVIFMAIDDGELLTKEELDIKYPKITPQQIGDLGKTIKW